MRRYVFVYEFWTKEGSDASFRWNGNRKKAYEDSRRLIETLEDLLEAGLSEEFALK